VAEGTVWFCYMVRCRDGSFYVGIANDVKERVKRHNWGVGPEYTAKRRPVQLVWDERCGDSRAARELEKEIKSWSRVKKLKLVARWQTQQALQDGTGNTPRPASRARGKGESSNG
jgi:predicted GIY-YIG superfamily endonuclease